MGNRELRLSYQEAIQLIRVGRFEEALALLKEIDQKKTDVKNVLYPMAVCCEKLGYADEGIDLCDQLIRDHDHEKAREIKARLELAVPYPEEAEMNAEEMPLPEPDQQEQAHDTPEFGGDAPAETGTESPPDAPPQPAVAAPRNKKPTWLVLLIALGLAAVVAALLHVFVLRSLLSLY